MTITAAEHSSKFAEVARAALENATGPEALDIICRAYRGDMDGYHVQQAATDADLRTMAAQLRTSDELVRVLHTVASAEILRGGRLDVHRQQLQRTVDQVRHLVLTAGDAAGAAETAAEADRLHMLLADLHDVLTAAPEQPEFPSAVVAFVPEQRTDRVGRFRSDDGAVVVTYMMVGWSLVVESGDAVEPRRLEPTFLVDGRSLPESFLRLTYGVRLQQLL